MKYINNFELFNEAVGVPSGMVQTAQTLLDKLLNVNFDRAFYEDLEDYPIEIRDNFTIADFKFSNINIYFNFYLAKEREDKIKLAGVQVSRAYTLGKQNKKMIMIQTPIKTDKSININFNFIINSEIYGKDIKEYFKENKTLVVGILSHELKHEYDSFKKPARNLISSSEYNVFSNASFEDIVPLNQFFYNLYYMHEIESLVRPSEMAGEIEELGVTKKDFYKYFTSSEMFKKLNGIKNYTFEKLKQDLKSYIPQIKGLLNSNDELKTLIQTGQIDNDYLIEIILKLAFVNLNNWKMDDLESTIQINPFALVVGLVDDQILTDRDRTLQSYQDKLMRFKDDYAAFYTFEINKMAKSAEKIIKKIAKLYSIAKEETNESKKCIVDPKLHYKYIAEPYKIKLKRNK
jgi:hypothetical protein